MLSELPPFTPQLEGFRLDEFHQQSLSLLAFPVEHDQQALDLAPFAIDPPTPPPEPPLPLLPYLWYPRPTQDVRDWALGRAMPPRPERFLGKARNHDAQQAMRPLLAGEGPVEVHGEPGMGKTTLLAHIASHERTRQRYRHIWWLDDPATVTQTLALTLNQAQVLTETNTQSQIYLLRAALNDNILLVIDNLSVEDVERFRDLTPHLLMGIDTEPEVREDAPPLDPPNVVTLRALPRLDGLELMMHACGLTDRNTLRGQMRAWISHIAELLGGHPLAITIASALFREDGLPMERVVELFSQRIEPDSPNPHVALDISLDALPSDYAELLEAFGALPASGACLEALMATTRLDSELAAHRGLSFLIKRGFITRDPRIGSYYIAHWLVWERMAQQAPHTKKNGERLRNWTLSMARRHREQPEQIYRVQREILYTLDQARQQRHNSFVQKLVLSMGAYLREYAPTYLEDNLTTPGLIGERARAATLVGDGLGLLEEGEWDQAFSTLQEGLALTRKFGSDHEIAEAQAALARYHDLIGNFDDAIHLLEDAARLVYDLGAEDSLHIIRIALAMVYRKQGRFKDALGVLDDRPDTYPERVRIYRATKQWDLMMKALEASDDISPYMRAEGYLQAGRYAEALEAISNAHDADSAFLRAIIYHLQDDLDNAVRGYEMALEKVTMHNSQRISILLAMGKAQLSRGNHERARQLFHQALDIYPMLTKPNELFKGEALSLLAALELIKGTLDKTIKLANEAHDTLAPLPEGHQIKADVYRTLGRAHLKREDWPAALEAFKAEVDHAQSALVRDDYRIGVALHHLADVYRANGEGGRAIPNYRLALTHKEPQLHRHSYFITQVALQQVLFEAERYAQALEICQMAINHLHGESPTNLQYLGYMLCRKALTEQELDRLDQAIKTLGSWLTLLTGRPDAFEDERPAVLLLAINLLGRSLLAHRRADEALPFAESALTIAEQHYAGTPIAWSTRRDLGEVYLQLEQWQATIDTFSSLLYADVEAEPFTYAIAHESTAIAHAHLDNLTTALQHLQVALDHHPIDHQKSLILERVADIHLIMGDADAAIAYTHQAIPLFDRDGFPGDAARILTKLAQLLSGTNRYADSIEIYEDALTMLRALPDADALHTARVYVSLASSHEAQGQYPQAAIAYRNALDTLETSRKSAPDDHRKILARLGAVQAAMHSYDDAISTYLQARLETEMYGNAHDLGLVITALADTYRMAERPAEALHAYEDALAVQPADDMPRERAATLRGYGQTLSLLGQLTEARQAWTEALTITTDAPASEIALTHRAIAQAFHAQQLYDEAEKAYQDALGYHQPATVETAATHRLYGQTLIAAGRHIDAIPHLEEALDTEKGLAQQVNGRIVETLDILADAQEAVGNLAAAIACHHEALVYTDRDLQPIQTARRYRTMGRLYTIQQRWVDAHTALEEALSIEFNRKPRSDNNIAQTLEMIAQAYRREGNLHKAAEAYKRMASYANLSQTASAELKQTLSEIQKHEGTLEAARASLDVLQGTRDADIKDIVYVYALVARSQAGLAQHDAANNTIDKLLTTLEQNADNLSIADEREQYRALAHVLEGSQAASEGQWIEARAHFQRALHETTDESMRWVIEQGLASVQQESG